MADPVERYFSLSTIACIRPRRPEPFNRRSTIFSFTSLPLRDEGDSCIRHSLVKPTLVCDLIHFPALLSTGLCLVLSTDKFVASRFPFTRMILMSAPSRGSSLDTPTLIQEGVSASRLRGRSFFGNLKTTPPHCSS